MATHSSILAWRIPGTEEPKWAAVYGVAQSRTRLKRLSSSSSSVYMSVLLSRLAQPCPTLLVSTSPFSVFLFFNTIFLNSFYSSEVKASA